MPDDLGVLLTAATDDPIGAATEAEALGYGTVWIGELWGVDAAVQLAAMAMATDDIRLGTAVLNVFSRTPAVLAMTAKTLAERSDGRFTLGVGTSTRKAVEDLHGMAWEAPNPVRRAHETIELTREFLAGDGRVDYEGEVFSVQDFPALGVEVPIYHAALGPANCRVVARLADGWLPHLVPYDDLGTAFEPIAEHARAAGRDPAAITVAPYVIAAVDDDPTVARDAVRRHVAYYVGSGAGYRRAVAARFPEAAETIPGAWAAGERDRAAGSVTDEMVDALSVAGTPEAARERLAAIRALPAVDRPILVVPTNAFDALGERTIEALAPSAA